MSLDAPLPARPQPESFLRKNIIDQALEYHKYLKADPPRSYLHVSRYFGVSRARVSQLINLLNRLPPQFVQKMKGSQDQKLIKAFSGKRLLKITSLKNPRQITSQIRQLKEKLLPQFK